MTEHRLEPLDHEVDAAGERLDVGGVDRRGTSRSAAGCGRACGRARCRRSRWRAGSRRRRRRGSTRRSRSCRSPASGARGRRRTAWCTPCARPSRRARSEEAVVRLTIASSPPWPFIQSSCSAIRNSVADRRGVVGLVLAGVVDRGRQVEERRDPAVARRDRGGPLERGRGHQRDPQPAVGGEGLLRSEVVGVDLGSGRPAARRRRRWRRPAPASRRRPTRRCTGAITAVEVSLCAQA